MTSSRTRVGLQPKASAIEELEGYVQMGMHQEARALAVQMLRNEKLSVEDFKEAVGTFLQIEDKLKPRIALVEDGYKRLNRKNRRKVRWTMLAFYYSLKDFKKAHSFASARPLDAGDFKFSLEVFEDQGDRARAEKLARYGYRVIPKIEDDFSRGTMLDALATYLTKRGEHSMAVDLLKAMPASSEDIYDRSLFIAKLHVAMAIKSILSGHETLQNSNDQSLAISQPGLQEKLIADAQKRLRRISKTLERVLPAKKWAEYGITSNRVDSERDEGGVTGVTRLGRS